MGFLWGEPHRLGTNLVPVLVVDLRKDHLFSMHPSFLNPEKKRGREAVEW